jgi:hypothetical protein
LPARAPHPLTALPTTQAPDPEPPAATAAATACDAPRLCPVTLALRPAALEAEFHAARGHVAASYDRWSLLISAAHMASLLASRNTLHDADGYRRALRAAAVAAMAAASLGARAWLWLAPVAYVRHREASMAAHRVARSIFYLVGS